MLLDNAAATISDAQWLPHRVDVARGQIQFVHLSRDDHRRATFLSDEYIAAEAPRRTLAIGDVDAAASGLTSPRCHFIFHSAFCCSTLMARALDVEGHCMGLKEPRVLQDLTEASLALGDPRRLRPHLSLVGGLLARPFGAGEAVIVKPTNIVNPIAEDLLAALPAAKALLLYSPLPAFLRSVASKGLFGRIWARKSLASHGRRAAFDPGYDDMARWLHTDLQVAALGWLQQQAQFARMARELPAGRVATLDSETFLKRPADALVAADRLFDLGLGTATIEAIVAGPVFRQDSKSHKPFDGEGRERQKMIVADAYAAEIDMVTNWADAVAKHAGVPLQLGSRLLRESA